MSETELYAALTLVQDEIKAREEGEFPEAVRTYLREDADDELRTEVAAGGGAVRLRFGAEQWDDGWFYNEHAGLLTLADGTTVEIDFFGSPVQDALTQLSAIRRREDHLESGSELIVDLINGAVKHE